MGYRLGGNEAPLGPVGRLIASCAVAGGMAVFGAQSVDAAPQVHQTATAQSQAAETTTTSVTTTTAVPETAPKPGVTDSESAQNVVIGAMGVAAIGLLIAGHYLRR
jgi:hypothetical protein